MSALVLQFLHELCRIYHEALVGALAYQAALVEGLDAEHQAAAVHFCQLAVAPYATAYGRGREMAHIHQCADGALSFVEVRQYALVACLFDECHEHGCGEDVDEAAAHASGAHPGGYDLFMMSFDSGLYHTKKVCILNAGCKLLLCKSHRVVERGGGYD